jgi:hypothetical protein
MVSSTIQSMAQSFSVVRRLARYSKNMMDNSKFRNKLPSLVFEVGLLDELGIHDTLSDWLGAVFEAKYWLNLLAALEVKPTVDNLFWEEFLSEWSNDNPHYQFLTVADRLKYQCQVEWFGSGSS